MADELTTKIANLDEIQAAKVEQVVDRLLADGTATEPLSSDDIAAAYDALPSEAKTRVSAEIKRSSERAARRAEILRDRESQAGETG